VGQQGIRDSHLLLPMPLKQLEKEFLGESNFPSHPTFQFLQEVFLTWDSSKKAFNLLLNIYLNIIKSFQKQVFEDFNQDIVRNLSLSSLAFKIYRSQYMEIDSIASSMVSSNMDIFFREASRGGYVDVFKPKAAGPVYHYDIISSYPAIMAQEELPYGQPWFVKKEDVDISKFFCFIELTVYIPKYLNKPPLSIRSPTTSKLINPTGLIRGYFFSE
jgi:hypothetical protein